MVSTMIPMALSPETLQAVPKESWVMYKATMMAQMGPFTSPASGPNTMYRKGSAVIMDPPGAPGGSIMTALPFLYMVFGPEAGDVNGPICAIMVALYITQDSFGTACNVSGDNAIGIIVDTINRKLFKA